MQSFYADVAAAGLPFGTPEIFRVEQVSSTSVTYERKLPDEPLQGRLDVDDREIGAAAVGCVIEVLRDLATVGATASMRQLAVLDEGQSFWANADTFRVALLGLPDRRVARFGPVIRAPARLRLPLRRLAGASRFDAAITANIMNMYGPHASAITQEFTARIAQDLGYPADVLLTYQAAYAVATSNDSSRRPVRCMTPAGPESSPRARRCDRATPTRPPSWRWT
jgi:hypothetical protein